MNCKRNSSHLSIVAIAVFYAAAISTTQSAPSQQQQQQQQQQHQQQQSSLASQKSVSSSDQQANVASSQISSSIAAAPQSHQAIVAGSGDSQRLSSSLTLAVPTPAQALSSSQQRAASTGSSLHMDSLGAIDKSVFGDDNFWRIPASLPKDLSSSGSGSPLRSSRDDSYVDEPDDDDDESYMPSAPVAPALLPIVKPPVTGLTVASGSLQPSVTVASTDLKTAAGFHRSSPYGHYGAGGDHYGGHYGAGHGYEPSYYHAGAADHHHDNHNYAGADHYGGKYYQYASVPKPYAWDFGYRRGNPYHTIERHEHGYGPKFQTKVKWADKNGGYGVHIWDYNHSPKHHYGHSEYSSHHSSGYKHH